MTDRLIETFTAPTKHRVDSLLTPSSLLSERALAVYAACASTCHMESAIAECGVAGGETAVGLVKLANGRDVFLFDTFGEFPLAARNNLAAQAVQTHARSRMEVERLLEAACVFAPDTIVNMVTGLFKETLPLFTKHLSFLHADGDLYESTCEIIEMAQRCMVVGGVVVFDDYGTEWTGVTRAVDEKLPSDWKTYAVAGVGQLVAVRV